MPDSPFEKVIDNNAGILSDDKEGSVRDVLEHYVNEAKENSDDDQFKFRMDIGTGYLFFSGFKETYDLLKVLVENKLLENIDDDGWDSDAPIRVVMGPETSGMTKKVLTSLIKDDISTYDDEAVELLKVLVDEDLIEFRVFLDKKFHAKLYSFYQWSPRPADVWAGSANFTRGGLSNNIELSIPMQVPSETRELYRNWFDELWKKSETDLDVLEIIDQVKKSDYLHYHPKHFFAKLIKLLEKEYLLEDEREWKDNILLDFQNLSYYITMERLQKYGGYILANSVGLGKSYVACQAMQSYLKKNPSKKCLLVAPPRLISEDEWLGYLEEFGIKDKVDVISMGDLQKTPYDDKEDDYFFDYREYREKYSLMVVDEIHHYRNRSNRTENLENIIKGNRGADSLFLSATPVNLGSEDLFNLIDLFYKGENVHKFENQDLKELYDETRSEAKKIGRGEREGLDKELMEKINKIERELTLKITWRIVQEHFEQDIRELSGEKVEYEEPDTTEASFTYPESYKRKIFQEIVPFLESLNYEPAKLWDGQGYKDDKNLTFWYKWQLYKRLESSLFSFYKSIRMLRDRFYVYKVSLEQEKMLSEGNLSLAPDISGTRYDEVMDNDRLKVVLMTFKDLDDEIKDKVIKKIKVDLEETEKMLAKLEGEFGDIEEIPFKDDKKLHKLENILQNNLEKDRPTIVFSEYKDTIDYLFDSLKENFDKIDYIHGSSGKSKEKLIKRFNEGELDIILTTDVLAEGVNLPRADSVINFDLPYNPVKLVQRAGRALRITNPKKIFVHNFKPEEDIDKELDLYDRLNARLNTILNTVGLDFVVWMMDEKMVSELHEEEMEEYLEYYSDYKEEVANTNPDDLFADTVPEESKLDRTIRRAVNKYNISSDFVEDVSSGTKKPFYTTLQDEEDFFYITQIGNKIKFINEVKETLEAVDDPALRKVTSSERSTIDNQIEEAEEDIIRERTSLRDLSRDMSNLLDRVRECKSKFDSSEMKRTLDNIIDLLANDFYQPDEIETIRNGISKIESQLDIIESFDDRIKDREFWSDLERLAKKAPSEDELELKAFIKYAGE